MSAVAERRAPIESHYRSVTAGGVEMKERADGQDGPPILYGHFAVFNQWTEVNNRVEGHFLERIAPGAFRKTFAESAAQIKVLFNHGRDPQYGLKPLGRVLMLEEDEKGAYYEVGLIDTSYNADIREMLRAGVLGASFRFPQPIREQVEQRPTRSAYNPQGIPEVTLQELKVIEFGPVTFGQYHDATSGVRSLNDLIDDVDTLRAAAPIIADDDRFGRTRAFISNDYRERSTAHRYDRVVEAIGRAVWAITPEMLATIIGIVGERVAGYQPTRDELDERIADGQASRDVQPEPASVPTPQGVAVIPIGGTIMPHAASVDDVSSSGTSIETLQEQFRQAMADPQIAAVVFEIDSPGGTVDLVPEFAEEIRAARGGKPIVAMANAYAASAAYWIASAADEFSVTPSGSVGSIGVYMAHEDRSAAFAQKGVDPTLISAGKYKTETSPFGPLSEEARESLQAQVDAYYEMFLGAVAEGRGVSSETVKSDYGQGRMLMAQDALQAGMVDHVETMDELLARITPAGPVATGSTAAKDGGTAPPSDSAEPADIAAAHPVSGRRGDSPRPIYPDGQTERPQWLMPPKN